MSRHPRIPALPGLRIVLAAAMALASSVALAAGPQDYREAKARADQDEAGLPASSRAAFQQSQSRQLETSVGNCAMPNPDLTPLVVVVEVDARGKILRTWRQGDTPLAICVEKELTGRYLEAPPRAPFYASFELSFTP